MTENNAYDDFMMKYQNFPEELLSLIDSLRSSLPTNVEDENYNLGTMQKDEDIGLSRNIAVINAHSFEKSFNDYKEKYPQISDTEAKARLVFDFLNEHGVNDFSYEQNKNDFLFKDDDGNDVTREKFYADAIYNNALTNTNFFDRNVGDIQILCLEPKSASDAPRNIKGLSQKKIDKFMNIPTEERLQILYKRGMYHESIHMAMGTTDERKCDVFALLKTMKEHPQHAETIFDIYNIQRSKMGYTIKTMRKKDGERKHRAVKNGAMTYLMPNTYKKLKEYAQNPQLIPQNDTELLTLTCKMTANPEFSKEQLSAFAKLMQQEHITPQDLAENKIVQTCMQQGGFGDIDKYIASDETLNKIISKENINNRLAKAKERLHINELHPETRHTDNTSFLRPPREQTTISDIGALTMYRNKKQNG